MGDYEKAIMKCRKFIILLTSEQKGKIERIKKQSIILCYFCFTNFFLMIKSAEL